MSHFDKKLNAGTMLALHMVELALRKHLKADQIIWTNMRVCEHEGVAAGWRQFTIGDGLVHVPGTLTLVWCETDVRLKKDGMDWAAEHICVRCAMPQLLTAAGVELPSEIKPITFYYCEGLGWDPGPSDVVLPSRRTRFPLPA